MTEENQGIDLEQVVAAYNQNLAELDKAKKIIDKMAINEARHTVEIAERDVVIDNLRARLANAQTPVAEEE